MSKLTSFYILIKNQCIITDNFICLFLITNFSEFHFSHSFNISHSWVFFCGWTMYGGKSQHLFHGYYICREGHTTFSSKHKTHTPEQKYSPNPLLSWRCFKLYCFLFNILTRGASKSQHHMLTYIVELSET